MRQIEPAQLAFRRTIKYYYLLTYLLRSDYTSENVFNSYRSDFLAVKNSSYDDIAERSKIPKAAILAVLEEVLAIVESVEATTAVKTLATATEAISWQ